MPNNRKVFVIGSRNYANWMESRVVERLEDADFVVAIGGADVNPTLYGERPHRATYFDAETDEYESRYICRAIGLNKPIWGTCRGAQLLCVLAGGKLVQDQPNPEFIHPMMTDDGSVRVSSTHHQAQYPWKLPKDEYKVVGWTHNWSAHHENGDGKEIVINCANSAGIDDPRFASYTPDLPEVEICYYRRINALGCQPHPEMLLERPGFDASISYFRGLLNKFLAGAL